MLRRLVVLSLLLLAGCAQNPAGLPLWQAKDVAPPSLQYLGVAGYLLRWQGEALTATLAADYSEFSNGNTSIYPIDDVGLAQTQHVAPVQLGGPVHVALGVDRALGLAGGA